MSQVAIWIGRSSIELSRKTGNDYTHKRVTYSINSLASQVKGALAAFLTGSDPAEISKVHIEWQLPYVAVEQQLGTPPAILTTAGTENWLELNLPLLPTYWSTQLARTPAPFSRELCFGVSERVSAKGEVLRAPDKEELDFLVSKLRLNKVTHVAVGFLHAPANSANELKVVEHFREQGFLVTASHEWPDVPEERPRWWAAAVENYADGFLSEKLTEITDAFVAAGVSVEKLFFHELPVASYQGPLRRWLKPLPFLSFPKPTLYCGIGELLWFGPNTNGSGPAKWSTSFGDVALPGVGAHRVTPSPVQIITRNFWNSIDWSPETVNFEPGPMCFGKGMTLTLLDVFYSTGKLQPAAGLSERLTEKNAKKIVDTLRAYVRAESGTRDDQDVIDELLRAVAESWRLQLNHTGAIHLHGPLASTVFNVFKHVGLDAGMVLHDDLFISDLILRGATR